MAIADQQQSALFGVPYEIRLEVYSYLIWDAGFREVVIDVRPRLLHPGILRLLMTCRRLHYEFKALVYRNLRLRTTMFPATIISFLRSMPASIRLNLRELRLRTDLVPDVYVEDWIRAWGKINFYITYNLPNLRSITFDLMWLSIYLELDYADWANHATLIPQLGTLKLWVYFPSTRDDREWRPKDQDFEKVHKFFRRLDMSMLIGFHERPREYIWHEEEQTDDELLPFWTTTHTIDRQRLSNVDSSIQLN